MTPEEHLAVLREQGARISAVTADQLDRPVPSCPGWDLARLIGHTSRVHRWAHAVVMAAPTTAEGSREAGHGIPRAPKGPEVLDYFTDGLAAFVSDLEAVDPDQPCWGFDGLVTTGFWFRRQAQETAVHRWDVEATVAGVQLGVADGIEGFAPDLAADGIDEWLHLFLPRRALPEGQEPWSLHLHGTDDPAPAAGAEWLVQFGRDGAVVTQEHAKGDVAVRGPVSDLLLVLWNRRPREQAAEVSTFGDPAPFDALLADLQV